MSDENSPGIASKIRSFLLLVVIGVLMLFSFKCGERGPDPRVWFAPPTFTPTATATATPTPTATSTFTATSTPTATFTPTAMPRPKIVHHAPVRRPVRRVAPRRVAQPKVPTGDEFDFPAASAPKNVGPQLVCTVTVTGQVIQEVEPNDVFYEAQDVGSLGMTGQITVEGTLAAVGNNAGSITGDMGARDPKTKDPNLDRDVYTFTVDQPGFRALLDCYTSKVGTPDPAQNDNDYQLEIYDEKFNMVAASLNNDPVEALECTAPGRSFFAVVYGVDGKPGKYRLTLIK